MVRIRRRVDMCEGCMYLTRNTSSSYYCECDGTNGVPEDFPSYASLLHGMGKEEFEKRLQQLREEEAEILSRIHQIEDGEVCRVMIARYIEFKPWAKIQREMHYSESGIMKLHRLGLAELDSKVKQ